jgi:hypothetical protein
MMAEYRMRVCKKCGKLLTTVPGYSTPEKSSRYQFGYLIMQLLLECVVVIFLLVAMVFTFDYQFNPAMKWGLIAMVLALFAEERRRCEHEA